MGVAPLSHCCRRCRRSLASKAFSAHASAGAGWLGRRNVLCFGDSLTEGFCDHGLSFKPYSDQLSSRLQELRTSAGAGAAAAQPLPRVINAGESGEKTCEMLARLPAFVRSATGPARRDGADGRPICGPLDVVLILGGTNDLLSLPAEKIVENLLGLHSMVHQSGAVSGVLTVPDVRMGMDSELEPFKEKLETINERLRDFAAQNPGRSFLVDVAAALPQDGAHAALWEPDGVHMSERGYRALGDLVASARLPDLPAAPPPSSLDRAPISPPPPRQRRQPIPLPPA